MSEKFELHYSNKRGFSDVNVIVTRGNTSYLRVVGKHPDFRVMTATASEDNREFLVCSDKIRLVSSALRLGAELNTTPIYDSDSSGRKFVHICVLHINSSEVSKEAEAQFNGAMERFFELFDSYSPDEPTDRDELRDIYDAISTDDSGDYMYLGDGVWLGGDGSLEDRGR